MKCGRPDADHVQVRSCGGCGAAMADGAQWCGQCFARVPSTTTFAAGASLPAAPVLMRTTRWGKTSTTFGPVGRILATIGLFVPLVVMTGAGFAVIFSWGGALVYAVVILPWGLRDVWQAGRIPVE